MRPERPIHFHRPESVHPAMKERGAAIPHTIPQRTLEKEARVRYTHKGAFVCMALAL